MSSVRWSWALVVLVGMVIVASSGLAVAADPPAAPKVSEFAPAADLAAQLQVYIGRAKSAVASEDEYKDAAGKLAKDANTLILIALALGVHDQDSEYKAAAPGLIKAGQELAAVKDFASAKAAVEKVEKAAASKEGNPADLKWSKVASLPELMGAVPLIHTRLKRNITGSKLKSKAKDSAGDTAVLAVIAQGSLYDTSAVKDPGDVAKWFKFCVEMRDSSAALNRAVHAGKADAAKESAEKLNQSCEDCHAVFKK